MDRRVDFAITVVAFALGVWLFLASQGLATGSVVDPLTPRGMPTLVAALLVGGAGLQGVRQLRSWSSPEAEAGRGEDEGDMPSSSLRVLVLFGALLAYITAMPIIGYVLVTPVFVIAAMWLWGGRSPTRLIVTGVTFTAVMYIMFTVLLGIRLPQGLLRGVL